MAPYIHKPTNNKFPLFKLLSFDQNWWRHYWWSSWLSTKCHADVLLSGRLLKRTKALWRHREENGSNLLWRKKTSFSVRNDFLSQLPFSSSFVRIRRTRRFVDRSFVVLPFDLYQPAIYEKLIGDHSQRDEFNLKFFNPLCESLMFCP